MRQTLMLPVAAFGLAIIVSAANSQPVSSVRAAPAPLLAAGIPALVALGGGATVARFVRRRRVRKEGELVATDEIN
jgi:hypothetical protein